MIVALLLGLVVRVYIRTSVSYVAPGRPGYEVAVGFLSALALPLKLYAFYVAEYVLAVRLMNILIRSLLRWDRKCGPTRP